MNLEQLKYVVEVAKTKSISAASQNLYVTPSAVSQAIIHLEDELGFKLFWRSRQGVTVTPEGASVVARALGIADHLEAIQAEAAAYRAKAEGRLKLAVVAGAVPYMLRAVADMRERYPELKIEIAEKGTQSIADALREEEFDLGVLSTRPSDKDKKELLRELKYEMITEAEIIAYISSAHPLASADSLTAEQLRKMMVVLYDDDYIQWFAEDFSSTFGPLDLLMTTHHADAIRRVIAEQMGAMIGFRFLPNPEPHLDPTTVPLPIEEYRQDKFEIGWVYPEKKPLSAMAKEFLARCDDIRRISAP